jgi:hypothetical protein
MQGLDGSKGMLSGAKEQCQNPLFEYGIVVDNIG